MKLRLTITADFEVDDFEGAYEIQQEVTEVIDQLNGSGDARGKLVLDLDSLKSRDREATIQEWE